ncbi:MAG: DUF11 domain-containing protein [Clostridia bacterium]|nr:DUF11 domain-containing protein [Clostridia bacterium]
MKVKNFLFSLVLTVFAIAISFSSSVFAAGQDADITTFVELNLTSDSTSGTEYGINYNQTTDGWTLITKIGTMNGSAFKRLYNAYCAYANIGFEKREDITEVPEKYIDNYNKMYVNESIGEVSLYSSNYKKILALADLFYLGESDNNDINNEDYKNYIEDIIKSYLNENDINYSSRTGDDQQAYFDTWYSARAITPEQVRAIQQLALWYYTNGQMDGMFVDEENAFLYFREVMNGSINGLNSDTVGDYQDSQAKYLFNYLITTAEANANNNIYGTNDVYLYVDDQADDEQPILLIKKGNKVFDLALRKFITEIKDANGNTISKPNREPDTSANTDLTGVPDGERTAKKEHDKTPLKVKKGNIVVYTIRVYNEGTVNGYADVVTDYLPAGLTLKPYTAGDGSINDINGWTANGQVVTTNKLAGTELTAANRDWTNFDENGKDVYYTDLQIECIVNENAKSNNLKNIAEITESHGIHGETDVDSDEGNVNSNPSNYNPTHPTTGRGEEDDDDFEDLKLNFDLALRKYITRVEDRSGNAILTNTDLGRTPNVDESTIPLTTGTTPTTATYKHKKDPVSVQTGYYVYYTLTVYNEGEVDGYATQIKDQLPEGLRFIEVASGNFEQDGTVGEDNILSLKRKSGLETQKAYENGKLVDNSESVVIKCQVTGKDSKKILTNLAWISGYYNNDEGTIVTEDLDSHSTTPSTKPSKDALVTDEIGYINEDKNATKTIDSSESYFEGQEDDDDFEKIIIENFDLALRKFISKITTKTSNYAESTEYTDRIPKITGNTIIEDTTAQKQHPKNKIAVTRGDKVVYTIRVYNEGSIAGRAAEVTDYLPDGLSLIPLTESTINTKYGWTESTDANGKTVITSTYMKNNNIVINPVEGNNNFDKLNDLDENNNPKYYYDLQVECIVNNGANSSENNLRNIAAITKYEDKNGNEITDIDSDKESVNPDNYNPQNPENGMGEQDDDDLEDLKLVEFDLALRKFITKVDTEDDSGKVVKEKVVTDRVPELSIDETTGNIKYTHTKEPLYVRPNDIVTYTLRIFNEGNVDGFASVITDDIPDGVAFIPAEQNATNKEYGWKMYAELPEGETVDGATEVIKCKVKEGEEERSFVETDDPTKAVIIRTDYLSYENGLDKMEAGSTVNPNLIKAFDKTAGLTDTNPDYRDIKVAFRVTEQYIKNKVNDKIITNFAQISDDQDEDGKPVNDIDSTPDKWNDGEDDQDIEKIRIPTFDLALKKWVTQAIVYENGEETVTNTNHDPWDDPEDVVKVELHRKKLSDVTVKFRYSIRVYNDGYDRETGKVKDGFVEGYAKEVTDYIPEGLMFVQEDNPDWTLVGDNIITTNKLENTLLKPGEYADVEVLLTWINGEDNLGLKTNVAEISKDENEWGAPDWDSTPNNKTPGEDDIDDAPVMLSITTGEDRTIILMSIGLGVAALATLAGGVFLIKKYVL